jgi:hypothetical protein
VTVAYYIVYDPVSGRDYAWTATPPTKLSAGLAVLELADKPADTQIWDRSTRTLVTAVAPAPRDRISEFKADIQTIYSSRLTAAQRAQVDAALQARFGDVKQVP